MNFLVQLQLLPLLLIRIAIISIDVFFLLFEWLKCELFAWLSVRLKEKRQLLIIRFVYTIVIWIHWVELMKKYYAFWSWSLKTKKKISNLLNIQVKSKRENETFSIERNFELSFLFVTLNSNEWSKLNYANTPKSHISTFINIILQRIFSSRLNAIIYQMCYIYFKCSSSLSSDIFFFLISSFCRCCCCCQI